MRFTAAHAVVALAAVLPTARAQTLGPLVQVSGASPFTNNTADNVPGQIQAAGSTLYPNSEVEPQVAVNPLNPNNIVGGHHQDRWSDGGARGLPAEVSMDGGATWKQVLIPGLTLTTGGVYQRASDPWLSFGPNGDLFHVSLSFNETTSGTTVLVSRSTDGGATWGNPKTLISPSTNDSDKESVTADPYDARYVYVVWIRFQSDRGGVWLARSTDGGATYEPAHMMYDPGTGNDAQGNQILVRPDGTLFDFFVQSTNTSETVSFVRSTDKGATWGPVGGGKVADLDFVETVDPDGSGLGVRSGDDLPEVAVDPNNGNLYAVWQDGRFSGGQFCSVAFSASTDGGTTWSAPIAINKTPSGLPALDRQAFTPSVHVAADGTIGVTYYDFRNNTTASGALTDYWFVQCRPAPGHLPTDAANWGPELRLTNASFDMERAPNAEGLFLGDYEGLTSIGNDFLAFFAATQPTDTASIFSRRIVEPLTGDVNGDGRVDVADVISTVQLYGGLIPSVANLRAGDTAPKPSTDPRGFGDNRLDLQDALRLLRHIEGLDPKLP